MSNEKCPFVVGEVYKTRNNYDAECLALRPAGSPGQRVVFEIQDMDGEYLQYTHVSGQVHAAHSGFDILPPAPKPEPTQDEVRYRELREGEHLRATDEFLSRDCASWLVVGFSNHGTTYSPGKHRPTRRVVEAIAPKLVERWVSVYRGSNDSYASNALHNSEGEAGARCPHAHSYHKIMVPE